MRITIARERLEEGLSAVASVVHGKATLPILGNVLLETTAGGLRISATDLDITVSMELPADVEVPGSATLPAKKFFEIARELPLASVRISSPTEQRAILECGAAKFRLLAVPAGEFPLIPTISSISTWNVIARDLHAVIFHTSFAASVEESRPILNGVLWELRPNLMRMVATNGHRLARMDSPFSSDITSLVAADFIIPPRALEFVRRLFRPDEMISIGRTDSHIVFRSAVTSIFSRLIEGPYPDYERVIPRDNPSIALLDRQNLIAVLRRMVVIASDQTHRVKLSFNSGILRFTVQTPDIGEAQDEMAVQYSGDPLEIGFNATYLLEILKYLPTDEIRVSLKSADHAVIVEPYSWNSRNEYLCLLMPLRLAD